MILVVWSVTTATDSLNWMLARKKNPGEGCSPAVWNKYTKVHASTYRKGMMVGHNKLPRLRNRAAELSRLSKNATWVRFKLGSTVLLFRCSHLEVGILERKSKTRSIGYSIIISSLSRLPPPPILSQHHIQRTQKIKPQPQQFSPPPSAPPPSSTAHQTLPHPNNHTPYSAPPPTDTTSSPPAS